MPEKQVEKNENAYDAVEAKLDVALAPLRELRKLNPDIIDAFTKGVSLLMSNPERFEELDKRVQELMATTESPEFMLRLAMDAQKIAAKMKEAFTPLELAGKAPTDIDFFDTAYRAIDDSTAMNASEKLVGRVLLGIMEFTTYTSIMASISGGLESAEWGSPGHVRRGPPDGIYASMRR